MTSFEIPQNRKQNQLKNNLIQISDQIIEAKKIQTLENFPGLSQMDIGENSKNSNVPSSANFGGKENQNNNNNKDLPRVSTESIFELIRRNSNIEKQQSFNYLNNQEQIKEDVDEEKCSDVGQNRQLTYQMSLNQNNFPHAINAN